MDFGTDTAQAYLRYAQIRGDDAERNPLYDIRTLRQ